MLEAEVAVMKLEDGGRDREPRNTGGHLETEKRQRNGFSLRACQRNLPCRHPDFSKVRLILDL